MVKKSKIQITNDKLENDSPEDVIARDEAISIDNDEQVDEKQLEIGNLKNQLARTLADYQNQNKRFQEERTQIFMYASQNVLENLLPVLDILEKAQEHLKDQGLALAISEFKRVLKEEGLEEIRPEVHNLFDPHTMEVVESVESKEEQEEKDTVSETVASGWKFKDGKVVRYAKVKVFI